jgi:phosphoglucomutase
MAHAHGVHFEETLTGFKWLGNRAHAMAPDYDVIFGYEEALGYMFPLISYDKDGIAAAALFLNAVQYWKSDDHIAGHMTPCEKLESLYQTYGYHESINTYFISPSPNYTRDFFNAIRMCKEVIDMEIGSFKILRWRDVTNGTEQPRAPHPNAFATTLPTDPNSQMLTFHMQHIPEKEEASGSVADLVTMTLRASGTEPKVKLYLECGSQSQKVARSLAGNVFEAVVGVWVLKYGKEMKPASHKIKSSSGVIHDILMDFTYDNPKGGRADSAKEKRCS